MKRLYHLLFLPILFFFGNVVFAQQYLETTPRNGEGMIELLRRYQLPNTTAMREKFSTLNNIRTSDVVNRGQRYKLPIRRYHYNGVSIRSTLKLQDYARAERIAAYNRAMREHGLRPDDFVISGDLWVPWHEWQGADAATRLVASTQTRPSRSAGGVRITSPVQVRPVSSSRPQSNTTKPSTTKPSAAKPTTAVVDYSRVKMQGRGTYKIFGAKYQRIRLLDRRLAGMVYYLDAGHGGPDPGTNTIYQGNIINEDEYAYDITLRLARRLLLHGATVFLTIRDEDDGIRDSWFLDNDREEVFGEGTTITGDLAERLYPRSSFVNERFDAFESSAIAQRFISIHVDGREGAIAFDPVDVHFLYHPDSPAGLNLSQILINTFRENYSRENRVYAGKATARDNLHVLKYVKPPAILVETGNIRSPQDQTRILNPANRQIMAEWICDGLLREARSLR